MMDKEQLPPADAGRLDSVVRALDQERADFDRWLRDSGHCEDQHDDMLVPLQRSLNQLMWSAWQAARAWVPMSKRKPKGGQLIVKRWRHGAVWAGTHNEGPKHEAFDEWKAL